MTVVTVVIVAATIAVCQTTEEPIAVTISVSSVSSVVMITGIVMAIPTVPSVEVTHIVPGGEEWSKLGIACNTFLYFLVINIFNVFSKKFHRRHRLYILEIPWIPMMMNIARIAAERSMVFMLLAQC